eukprot:NODE_1670_length_1644_cov_94.491782_g1591_i0.p1 GENE.NODE_1670_length_1644_cov_94.491782_g1591_i0~~NODE_1670_length_1644_cov_94.491782_g1591_i0.p1  ORF type:complete len:280 (-),score=53.27 NODE_1670_length_1644_cov_94.491782_g1591_i0:30-869(-)
MNRFLRENSDTRKICESQAVLDLEGFSVDYEVSVEGLLGYVAKEGEDAQEGVDGPVLIRRRDRVPLDILRRLPFAQKALRKGHQTAATPAEEEDLEADEGTANFQVRPLMELNLDGTAASATAERKKGLILVASLLENVPNIAGLTRSCEIFGCEALTLSNRKVATEDAFKRVSVTAERWLPLVEVAAQDLPTYLREQKLLGYTIVGVEQAQHSVSLSKFTFPKLSVLVLGNEQQGIPATLLDHLDVVVEIDQFGVTRSLNAHVSGALAVWQYTRSVGL